MTQQASRLRMPLPSLARPTSDCAARYQRKPISPAVLFVPKTRAQIGLRRGIYGRVVGRQALDSVLLTTKSYAESSELFFDIK
jgi:hypothetical protein